MDILDAGKLNLLTEASITLWKSGVVIGPDTTVNPVVVISNYIFDTLNSDTFQVNDGVLYEGLISVGSKKSYEADPLNPGIKLFSVKHI